MSRFAALSGLLLLDKPSGWTSHDAVRWARRQLSIRRVGHAGTLDPLARGLLPILIGPATRLARFLHLWDKSYAGIIRLGAETPSDDSEFAPPDLLPPPMPTPALLATARDRLSGRYLQRPPAYSAKKIGGVPAYRIARQGFDPAVVPVPVTVYRLRLVSAASGTIMFAARVSSGTYIRSLARDLGRILGTGGHLESLRRSAIGPLHLRQAISPDRELGAADLLDRLIPPHEIPLPFATATLDAGELTRFRAGSRVADVAAAAGPAGFVRILGPDGKLAGIAERGEEASMRPRVVLPFEPEIGGLPPSAR